MVELEIDQDFPVMIQFRNEKGFIVEQKVIYGQKPMFCTSYKGYGHRKEECVKKIQHNIVWVVKDAATTKPVVAQNDSMPKEGDR